MQPDYDGPVPHDPAWAAAFASECELLQKVLRGDITAIHHIGSTAIPGILAKPVIDILAEAGDLDRIDRRQDGMRAAGYVAKGEYGLPGRRYFQKQDPTGKRTHHLHIYAAGSPEVTRHLAFRDYLRAQPEKAAAYSSLKRAIVDDWQGKADYIERKASLVAQLERQALAWKAAG